MTSREEAKDLIRQMVDAYNRKDTEAVSSLYADDIRLWSALGPDVRGKSAAVAHLEDLFASLPDERMTIDTIVADEGTVVIEVTSRGTDPQGASYEIAFTEVFRVEANLVREIRTYIDPDDVAHVGE
jgi:steroid delta-isomerase-like uncharacterized protein